MSTYKGRNTHIVSARIPVKLWLKICYLAEERKMNVNDWVKINLAKVARYSLKHDGDIVAKPRLQEDESVVVKDYTDKINEMPELKPENESDLFDDGVDDTEDDGEDWEEDDVAD